MQNTFQDMEIDTDKNRSSYLPESNSNINDMIEIHSLSTVEDSMETIFYITDIHIEHQLEKEPNKQKCLGDKIKKLLEPVKNTSDILLIGGDVAHSIRLTSLFYQEVSLLAPRLQIFAVLGNHELWDDNPFGIKPTRPVDEIIADYRKNMPSNVTLLENQLFIVYKGSRREVLNENVILNANIEKLARVCKDSTFLLLGGVGFSGLNPEFNADRRLYRKTVSMEEDIIRTNRFQTVYEKVLAAAKDVPVIVLTHMPMRNWSTDRYNLKWIYVNGHTHQNSFSLFEDGTAVFSDNQVGYKPVPWVLKGFTRDVHRYDPFKNYPNGRHLITREQYLFFNRCLGINVKNMSYPGDLYMLKQNGIYMFVLQTTKALYHLNGGQRKKLSRSIEYYECNLSTYAKKVQKLFSSYHEALQSVSGEIRSLGGNGVIHGCIVDIDFFNHIYINPLDGTITPYFAWSMTDKLVFKSVNALLQFSPMPPLLQNGESMAMHFATLSSNLPILSNTKQGLSSQPQFVSDTSMYKISRFMCSIGYLFDQNVIRVWSDVIFNVKETDDPKTLSINDLVES